MPLSDNTPLFGGAADPAAGSASNPIDINNNEAVQARGQGMVGALSGAMNDTADGASLGDSADPLAGAGLAGNPAGSALPGSGTLPGGNLDNNGQPQGTNGQPGSYGGQPGSYGGQPGSSNGGQPGSNGGQPGSYGGQPSSYGGQPGNSGANPNVLHSNDA